MTDDRDRRLAEILQREGPGARDMLFRLSVHARRERERFHRRAALLALAAAIVCVLAAMGARLAGAQLLETTGVVFFGVVLTLAGLVFAPMLPRLLRPFRVRAHR